jgi:hypothetical protein
MTPIPYEEIYAKKERQAYQEANREFSKFQAIWRGCNGGGEFGDDIPKLSEWQDRIYKKIKDVSQKRGIDVDQVVKECELSSILVGELFAKDPGRQTLHQGAAEEYMKKWTLQCHMENFTLLKSGGGTSKHLTGGRVVSEQEMGGSKKTNKSIDFEWSYTGLLSKPIRFYATHKYTKQDGGAQDNQRKDIETFIESTHTSKDTKEEYVYFFAIGDGPYYKKPYEAGSKQTRLEELQTHASQNGKCFVTESHLVPHKCLDLIAKAYKMENKPVPEEIRVALTESSQIRLDLSVDKCDEISFEQQPVIEKKTRSNKI